MLGFAEYHLAEIFVDLVGYVGIKLSKLTEHSDFQLVSASPLDLINLWHYRWSKVFLINRFVRWFQARRVSDKTSNRHMFVPIAFLYMIYLVHVCPDAKQNYKICFWNHQNSSCSAELSSICVKSFEGEFSAVMYRIVS